MKKSVIVVVCLLLVGIFGWSIAKANSADIKVHLGAGTIVMDQQELVLTPDEAIMVQEDTVYLPLRPLMEKMDYQVFWDAGMQNVSMEKGDQTYFMTIGSNQYVNHYFGQRSDFSKWQDYGAGYILYQRHEQNC